MTHSAILGAFVSTIALLSCAFVNKIEYYFLTFGFLFGVGQSILMIATFAILPHYFKKKLGLANGLMNMGGSIITIALPILVKYCLTKLDLRYTWFVLALLSFLTFLFSFFFVPVWNESDKIKHEDNKIEDIKDHSYFNLNENHVQIVVSDKMTKKKGNLCSNKLKDSFGCQIFKNYDFDIWSLGSVFGIAGVIIPLMTIVSFYFIFFSKIINLIFIYSTKIK